MTAVKFLVIAIAGLLCLSSCSKDNPSSSDTITEACNPATALRRNAFVLNGNGYSNISVNLDTIGASETTILMYSNGVYSYSNITSPVILNSDTVSLFLKLRVQNVASGSYSWGDRSRDTNAMGCSLVLYDIYSSSSHSYNSVSGGTNMKLFQTNPVLWDSIFSSYCGTLKDSLGNTITLTSGTFYMTH